MALILIEPPPPEPFKFRVQAGPYFLRGPEWVEQKTKATRYQTKDAALDAFDKARDFNPLINMRAEVVQ